MKTIFTALFSAIVGGLVAILFIFFGLLNLEDESGGVTFKESKAPVDTKSSGGGDSSTVRQVYGEDGPGVVSVDVASSEMGPGGGSGFVVDEEGHIVTNQHVVEGAEGVSVRFASGARETAEVVGEDPSTDVAVIKVDAPKSVLKPLTFGDSDSARVGDPVIAIGNPLNVGLSVTTGIVSGTERPIEAPNSYTIDGAIQTDAAISSGNSGGPLLDAGGSVIGINSQVASAGGQGVAQGVGFAVPVNTVKSVVEQLITNGEVVHGFIGVRMFEIGVGDLPAYTALSESDLRDDYGLPKSGAIVSEVSPGGPADEAGIKGGETQDVEGIDVPMGDVITEVEGEPVDSADDVIEVVNARKPGDRVNLTVVSPDEEPRSVQVTLESQPDDA